MLSLPTALAALLVSDSFYSIYGLHKYGIHPGAEIWLEGFIGVLIIVWSICKATPPHSRSVKSRSGVWKVGDKRKADVYDRLKHRINWVDFAHLAQRKQ